MERVYQAVVFVMTIASVIGPQKTRFSPFRRAVRSLVGDSPYRKRSQDVAVSHVEKEAVTLAVTASSYCPSRSSFAGST